jgi:sarcosine oxidase
MHALNVDSTYDVAVIGAGVFGAWTAYKLQRAGKRVALLDTHGPGHSRSSSGGESRVIRMGYGADEIYTRSALRSLEIWQEFFAHTNEPLFHQTGVLWLAHDDDPYPVECVKALRKFVIPFESLTKSEVHRRYPQLGLDRVSWAMFEPESGVVLARRAVQAVVAESIKNGVAYLQDEVIAPAVSDPDDTQTTRLDHLETASARRISAGQFVFACGPWMPRMFPQLLKDRIAVTRQEVFFFGVPPGRSFASPALPAWIDFKEEVYGLPDLDGRGVKIAIDRHGAAFDPEQGERVVTAEGLAEVRERLARRLPQLKDAPVIETRVCQYESTSNGDFLIDLHPQFSNVWLVGGGSGHGFKHGPSVAEYVNARIKGVNEGIEPRFSLQTKGGEHHRTVY